MTHSRPDLIVPIRDRRQGKRYLTLRNFGIAVFVLAFAFLLITIRSEMRGLRPGDYGGLVHREMPDPVQATKPTEVVREAAPAVPDQTAADPTLVEPMARAQWLDGTNATTAAIVPAPAPQQTVTYQAPVAGNAHVAIVGGAEGVAIVKEAPKRPTLKGGFGRQ
jgi:membrane-associated protease RseP (regulator of RpoE activity)